MGTSAFLIVIGALAVLESTILWMPIHLYRRWVWRTKWHRRRRKEDAGFRWSVYHAKWVMGHPWYRPALFVIGVALAIAGIVLA